VQQRRGRLFGRHPAAIARVFAQHKIAQLQVFISPVVQQQPQPKQSGWFIYFLFFLFRLLLFFWPVSWQKCAPLPFLSNGSCRVCHRVRHVQDIATRLAGTGPESAAGGSGQLLRPPGGGSSSASGISAKEDSGVSSASGVRSCDDLLFQSASDLASRGRFGGGVTALAVPTRYSLSQHQQQQQQQHRRPSIFRRCYSSESNAIVVPSWFSSSFGSPSTCGAAQQQQQQQQQQGAGSTELLAASNNSSYSLAGVSQQQQPADVSAGNAVLADALVDCLPPYYWEAKHMPRLVKVSFFFFFLAGQAGQKNKKK
jgi:hypothetical protein